MKQTITLILILLSLNTFAQSEQNGLVRIQNSNNTPLAGVQIIFTDAVSTDSDNTGNFQLVFKSKKPGDNIFYSKIYKKDYELVNEKELLSAKLSKDNILLSIVMAEKGSIATARAEYYEISEKELTKNYSLKIEELKIQLKNEEIKAKTYQNEIDSLTSLYENQIEQLTNLADKFARINFDDVSKEYKQALELFKQGKIDSSLTLLESVDLLGRTEKRIEEYKNIYENEQEILAQKIANDKGIQEDMQAVKLATDLYVLQFEYEKADKMYDLLWQLDTTNFENTFDYATFSSDRHSFSKSIILYEKALSITNNNFQKIRVFNKLGELYRIIHKYDIARNKLRTAYDMLDTLPEVPPAFQIDKIENWVRYGALLISTHDFAFAEMILLDAESTIEKLIIHDTIYIKDIIEVEFLLIDLYAMVGRYNKMEEYCNSAFRNIYTDSLTIDKRLLAKVLYMYGRYYTIQKDYDNAKFYNVESLKLYIELAKNDPKQYNEVVAGIYQNLGLISMREDDVESSEKYLVLSMNMQKQLYEQYPQVYFLGYSQSLILYSVVKSYQQNSEEAITSINRAIEILEDHAIENVENPLLQTAISTKYNIEKLNNNKK